MSEELSFDAFQALYGPWRPLDPVQVASLFAGSDFRWWIGGGWAVDAASGVTRFHEDIDVIVLRDELPEVRRHLEGFHVWEAESGVFRLLRAGQQPREEVSQLWVRADAYSPWVLDLLLTPSDRDDWLYKRDHRIRRPIGDIGFTGADGIAYLKPEIVVLFKAKLRRRKDDADFQTLLPHLSTADRTFLVDALRMTEPDHPWLATLTSSV